MTEEVASTFGASRFLRDGELVGIVGPGRWSGCRPGDGATTVCFSLLASVAAGATLAAAGGVTVTLVRRRAELPFAMLPLLFGVQQLSEGVVWWSLDHSAATLNSASTLTYMLFSHVLWPVFVPFSFLCMETVRWRRRLMVMFVGIGVVVALAGLHTVFAGSHTSRVSRDSIQYDLPPWYVVALYLFATCIGALCSSRTLIKGMGAAALALALVTLWLYVSVFVSLWCFFCALLTVMIFASYLSKRSREVAEAPIVG